MFAIGENLSKHLAPSGLEDISWSDISIIFSVIDGSGRVINLEYTSRSRSFISAKARLYKMSAHPQSETQIE